MDPSSSMPLPPSLHLAMAALLGASFMAISAFYIHRRTVDHVLHRLLEIRRAPPSATLRHNNEEHDVDGDETETETDTINYQESLSKSIDENTLRRSYRISSSMPNVVSATDWFQENPRNHASSLDNLKFALLELPSLRNGGDSDQISCSYKRLSSIGRIKTPRSPGRNAFESADDSDEERTQIADDNSVPFYPRTADSSNNYGLNSNICNLSAVPFTVNDASSAKIQMYGEISKEARAGADTNGDGMSDSTSAQVAVNDLAFINNVLPVRNTTREPTNIEEEEVCKMIRECLDLRKKYVYKENVVPWKAEPVATNPDPFHFEPIEATAHHFSMEDGVVHVYASKTDTEELFPVASSTTFFTDLHYILKVMSIGNVCSACYHRL